MTRDSTARDGGETGPEEYGFLLCRDFSMMCFSSAVEPLRQANRLTGKTLYRWTILSIDGAPVRASNGIEVIAHAGIDAVPRLPNVLVVAGMNAHLIQDKHLFAWLRKLDRQGCRIGALSTGSYVLARAGLLDGHRCTIHWENLESFREDFPNLEASLEVFEIHEGRMTSSGGTASLDMMLFLISQAHGRQLATEVAEQFIHERIRETSEHQRMSLRSRLGVSHPKLLKVVELMEQNLEEPLPRTELARRCGLSPRQLERLFRKYLGRTPTRFYLELRLDKARTLLCQTSMSILDVALACGFVSASHFSKCYREYFQRTPRAERSASA